jgi:transcriptional regulator GlxA family with amidase domain
MNVQLLVYDGFRELDLFGAQEVFTRTAAAGARISVERVRVGSGTVTSGYGLQVHVPPVLGSARMPDVLLVPGGDWLPDASDNPWTARQIATLGAAIAATHANGVLVAAVGWGVVLLAEGEMLSGRSVAAPAGAAERLALAGARVVPAALVDDGDLISGVGAGAGIDVGLRLLERAGGADLAERIAEGMGHPRVRVEVTA